MEKNKVLECSRWTASNSPNNATWTNEFINAPTVNEGDIIAVRNSFIDTRLIDANSVQIVEDTTLTFNFVYYLINNGLSMNYIKIRIVQDDFPYPDVYTTFTQPNVGSPPINIAGPDGLPYILVNADLKSNLYNKPVIETVNIKIAAGVYERASLAEIITRQCESIGKPTNQKINNPVPSQFFTNGNVNAETFSDGSFFQFSKPASPPDPFKVITTIQKQLFYGVVATQPSNVPSVRFKHGLFYLDSKNELVPCLFVPMTDNINYTPMPIDDSSYIIAPFQSFDKLSNVDPIIENQYTETPAQGTTPAVVYSYTMFDAGFVGANQFSLVYNDENGNGKFSFQYMHTPITQSNNEVVMAYTKQFGRPDPGSIFNKSVSYFTAMGGVMLVNAYTKYNPLKMEDDPFLTQLGFNKLSDIIPMDDLPIVFNGNNNWLSPTHNKFKYTNFLKYTTRNYASFPTLYQPGGTLTLPSIEDKAVLTMDTHKSMFFSNYNTDPNVADPYDGSGFNSVESTITEGIVASTFPIGSNTLTGHYLIELSGYNSEFINHDKLFNVKSIVGNYYFSENFAMELGFDSFIYQHRGEPITLSQIQVRILSPYTKDIISVGPNSSVYLQISNQIEQPPQEKK